MYQLHVAVHQTVGAHIIQATLSDTTDDGETALVASYGPVFVEDHHGDLQDDLTELLLAVKRWSSLVVTDPSRAFRNRV